MSNDNEIYPLGEYALGGGVIPSRKRRPVNQRLAPIYKALLDDPEGWKCEYQFVEGWTEFNGLPVEHADCDNFRLVRKRKTITVESMPKPHSFLDEPGCSQPTLGGPCELCYE